MIAGFNFAPVHWAFCNGQLLPISQNTALFSLLGTQYGGDGKTNFALPNLQSRAPIHQGQGIGLAPRAMGELGGEETVSLTGSQTASHTHSVNASTVAADQQSPAANVPAAEPSGQTMFYAPSPGSTMASDTLAAAGQGFPHNNMQPYLTVNFCIALTGIFPSRG